MSFVFAAIKINSMQLQCYGKNSPLKWSWSLATQINIINRLSLFPSAAELERGDISPYPGAVSPIDTQNLKQLTILELKHATNNFSEINIIGEGSFGLAYKGLLQDGSLVVIKRHLHTQIQNFLHEVTLALGRSFHLAFGWQKTWYFYCLNCSIQIPWSYFKDLCCTYYSNFSQYAKYWCPKNSFHFRTH